MSVIDALRYRLGALLHPRDWQRELDEELAHHLSLDTMQREHAARGRLSTTDARWAARRRLGNATRISEETRRMAGLDTLETARQDLRFALRTFRRTPIFTAVAVLTLAIGIGANVAIFSAVNALLVRPLPFAEPERLMKVSLSWPARGEWPGRDDVVWSYPKFLAFREAQHVFQDLTLWTDAESTTRVRGEAARESGELVDSRYLPTLGLHPALGRNFLPSEDQHPGGPRVAILSDELWQRDFDADPSAVGRTLDIDGDPYTIVGIMPPGFRGISGKASFWIPILAQPAEVVNEAWNHSYYLVARLAPGITPERATAEVRRLGTLVDAAFPNPDGVKSHWGATARPLDATRVDPVVRRTLLVLLGAVGLVLLIACANVANLFLVRAAGRRREIAVRLAVGAGRGRLVRQLLTESVALAALGGVASLVVAWWGVKALAALHPTNVLRLAETTGLGLVNFGTIRLDAVAFAFAAALAVATGLLFGLVPALQGTRISLTGALKEESAPARGGLRGLAGRNVLAAIEIALAVVLLAGSGLMLRSLGRLLGVNPGFDAEHVLTLRVSRAPDHARDSLPVLYDQLLDRLGALPGVTGVAIGDCPPLNGGCNGTAILLRDRPRPAPGMEAETGVHWITPSWPATLRVPLLRGRTFTRDDRQGTRKVVLVNETAARTLWPGQDPIGRPVSVGQGGFWEDTAYVVGVVGDVRYATLDSLPRRDVYLSYYQSPAGRLMLYLRTRGDPRAIATAARRAIAEVAPGFPVYDVRTLESRVGDAVSYARFAALLLALFALVALALATMGTYGVISFAVAQRRHEIGVRVALGATRADVVRLVVRQGALLLAAGIGAGLAAALAATRVLRSLLYGVQPTDPATFGAIVAVLAVAALAASWIPARRAAGIPAVQAMRGE